MPFARLTTNYLNPKNGIPIRDATMSVLLCKLCDIWEYTSLISRVGWTPFVVSQMAIFLNPSCDISSTSKWNWARCPFSLNIMRPVMPCSVFCVGQKKERPETGSFNSLHFKTYLINGRHYLLALWPVCIISITPNRNWLHFSSSMHFLDYSGKYFDCVMSNSRFRL